MSDIQIKALSKGQRQRWNRQQRKAGIVADAKQAHNSVQLRCALKAEALAGSAEARKSYYNLTGCTVGAPSSKGFYDGHKAKGRKRVHGRMDLAGHYAAKYN